MAERSIISLASRSTCAVLRRPLNSTCSHWSISRMISALRLEGPLPADLLVDRDQFRTQFLEAMVLIDFGLCLPPGGGRRKRFGDGSSFDFTGKSNLGIVPWVVGFGAVAGRFSAAARNRADRTRAQIAGGGELTKDFRALGWQLRQRIWQRGGLLILSASAPSEQCHKKGIRAIRHFCVAHPLDRMHLQKLR